MTDQQRQLLDLFEQYQPKTQTQTPKTGGGVVSYGPSAEEFRQRLLRDEEDLLLAVAVLTD